MGAVVYFRYFNAIADALHSVNPDSLVGGPVASWWNGIDLPTFAEHSGTRLGFIDFHSYPVGRTDSKQSIYEKAASFSDVRNARMALAGMPYLPSGCLPPFMLYWSTRRAAAVHRPLAGPGSRPGLVFVVTGPTYGNNGPTQAGVIRLD